jgi:hypothetical protein
MNTVHVLLVAFNTFNQRPTRLAYTTNSTAAGHSVKVEMRCAVSMDNHVVHMCKHNTNDIARCGHCIHMHLNCCCKWDGTPPKAFSQAQHLLPYSQYSHLETSYILVKQYMMHYYSYYLCYEHNIQYYCAHLSHRRD